MNPDSPLARLAAACGIESGYHDIWGTWHALGEDTARRLLGAMGIVVTDDESIQTALRAQHAAQWTQLLPPVCVRQEGETAWLPLTLAEADEGAVIHWWLCDENGSEQSGTTLAGDHEVLEEAELDGRRCRRRRFNLPWAPSTGYHEVTVSLNQRAHRVTLIVTPARCVQPPSGGARGRPWGVTLQLYGVRSARNWGIGDLGDLARAATVFGGLGADLIGVNPLHALYPDAPDRASPYSPSSRCFANPLYLDIEAIPDFEECDAARALVSAADFQAELERLRSTDLVDYAGVAALKWPVLKALYQHFRSHATSTTSERAKAFRQFQAAGGRALRLHAIFEVIHADAAGAVWADEYLDPDSPAVAEFERAHTIDV